MNKKIKFFTFKFSKKNDLGFPFTYINILNKYQFYKSYQIMMEVNNNWAGLARLHYLNNKTFELGDFFIIPDLRGKKYKGKKYYQYLMDEVLKKAKIKNKNIKEITLAVEENHKPAIHIYSKNGFKIFKNKSIQRFTFPKKKFIYMKLKL